MLPRAPWRALLYSLGFHPPSLLSPHLFWGSQTEGALFPRTLEKAVGGHLAGSFLLPAGSAGGGARGVGSRGGASTHHIEWLWQKSSAEMICLKNFRASLGVSRPFLTR